MSGVAGPAILVQEHRGRRVALFAALAGVIGAAIFIAVHAFNYYHYIAPFYRRVAVSYPDPPMGRISLTHELVRYSIVNLPLYIGFALAGAAIAAKTRDRFLWMLPGALFVFSPIPGMLVLQDRPALRPILDPYFIAGSGPGVWLGAFALIDLALVLLPGAFVAFRVVDRRPRVDGHARLAFALCAVLAVFIYLRQQYVQYGAFDVNTGAHLTLGILFVVGAALGVKRGGFPWVHLVVAFCFSEALWRVAEWIDPFDRSIVTNLGQLRSIGMAYLPQLTAVGLGALSDPLARYLRSRPSRVGSASQAA